MRPEVQLAVCVLCLAILVPHAIAQSDTDLATQVKPPERPARLRPGE